MEFYQHLYEEHTTNPKLKKIHANLLSLILMRTEAMNKYDKVEDCPICLEPISKMKLWEGNCGHRFHIDCIRKWSNIKMKCPLCKENLCNCGKCCEEEELRETITKLMDELGLNISFIESN